MMDIKRQNESTVENDKGEETGLVQIQSQTNKMVTHNARDKPVGASCLFKDRFPGNLQIFQPVKASSIMVFWGSEESLERRGVHVSGASERQALPVCVGHSVVRLLGGGYVQLWVQ